MFKIGDKVKMIRKHLGAQSFNDLLRHNPSNILYIIDIKDDIFYCYSTKNGSITGSWWFTVDELVPYDSNQLLIDFYLKLC